MRQIKFRGKRIDNGEWVYGFYYTVEDKHFIFSFELKRETNTSNSFGEFYHDEKVYEVDEKTVGQFTGLHDKNGKEIYEGDIIKENCDLYEVYYNEKNARFILKSIDNDVMKDHSLDSFHKYEVICNIYDW